jgi:hypothetical protein
MSFTVDSLHSFPFDFGAHVGKKTAVFELDRILTVLKTNKHIFTFSGKIVLTCKKRKS